MNQTATAVKRCVSRDLSTSASPAGGERGLRILLADDADLHRQLATRLLQNAGHQVTSVAGGRDAVFEAVDTEFDLILMDTQMPDLDGLTATKILRACGRSMPIISLGAPTTDAERRTRYDAGMSGCLAKPFTLPVFEAAAASVLPVR